MWFLAQSIFGLWIFSQSVPKSMSWSPVFVIRNSVVSPCFIPISIRSIAACSIAPCWFLLPSTLVGNMGACNSCVDSACFCMNLVWQYMPSAPLSRSARASIFSPLCTIRTLRRIEGVRLFRIVFTFTGEVLTARIVPRVFIVQRGNDTTLLDDAARGFTENSR